VHGTLAGTSVLGSLSITGSGKFDLKDNHLIVNGNAGSWSGTAYTGVIGMVQAGYNHGAQNGSGIVTSMSSAISPSVLTTLVAMSAEDAGKVGGTFGGQGVAAGDALVMYTWGGDANMDGLLNGDDYFRIDGHVGQNGSVFGYHNGDFNYDGLINGDDYFVIDSNIATAQSSPAFPTGDGVAPLTAVPEPAIAWAAFGVCGMLRRRRRVS